MQPGADAAYPSSPNAQQLESVTFITFPDARMTLYPWMVPPETHQPAHMAGGPAPSPLLNTTATTCPECKRVILAFSIESHRLWCPGEPVNLAEEMGAANGITARGLPKRAAAVPRGKRVPTGNAAICKPAEATAGVPAAASLPSARRPPSRSASAGGRGSNPKTGTTADLSGRNMSAAAVCRKPRASPLCNVATAGPSAAKAPADPGTATGPVALPRKPPDLHHMMVITPRKRRSARQLAPRSPLFLPFKDTSPHPTATTVPRTVAGSKRANWRPSAAGLNPARRPLHGDSGEQGLPGLTLGAAVVQASSKPLAQNHAARSELQVLLTCL
jgi:hypothetical protein